MLETTYKKDSWHYRIVISKNMLINNMFNTHQKWLPLEDDDKEFCYQYYPPTNTCDYWSVVLMYIFLQIPLMIMGGAIFIAGFLLFPIATCWLFFVEGVHTQEINLGLTMCISYIGFMIYGFLEQYFKTPDFFNDIKEVKEAVKGKLCKKINFK